jgi:hypothetical protein
MFEWKKFIQDVASVSEGDYSAGFKMLGFVLFVSQCGPEWLLAGQMVLFLAGTGCRVAGLVGLKLSD